MKLEWQRICQVAVKGDKRDVYRSWNPEKGYVYEMRKDDEIHEIHKKVQRKNTNWFFKDNSTLPETYSLMISQYDKLAGFSELSTYVACLVNMEKEVGLLNQKEEKAIMEYMETDFFMLKAIYESARQEFKRQRKARKSYCGNISNLLT